MDISKEVDKLSTKYSDIQRELHIEYDIMYYNKAQVTKDEKDSLDDKIKKSKYVTDFIKELLGPRLSDAVNDEFDGKAFSIDDDDYSNDNYFELLLYYPMFDDKTIEEYVNKILENGIDKTAQEWFNSDNHKKVHEFYNMNSGLNSNCYNIMLKIISESWKLSGKDDYLNMVLTTTPFPLFIKGLEKSVLKNGYTKDWADKVLGDIDFPY